MDSVWESRYARSKLWIFITALASLPFWGMVEAAGQQPIQRGGLPTLTTAHEVHSLSSAEAARAYPVRLRGVVTYYDTYFSISVLMVPSLSFLMHPAASSSSLLRRRRQCSPATS